MSKRMSAAQMGLRVPPVSSCPSETILQRGGNPLAQNLECDTCI